MNSVESLEFNNWTVHIHRRARRATMTIHLYPHKPIKVTTAMGTTHQMIVQFLSLKKVWIEKNLQKFSRLPAPESKEFKLNETFPFLGRGLVFKPVITLHQKKFISVTEENLLLHIPRDDWSASILIQNHQAALQVIRMFYKREAIKDLTSRVQHWSQKMGLRPRQLRFREQRTRWGSCSSTGAINLNWRLIVFQPHIIDYVVVHELCHLKHMNHSADFWNLVQEFIPEYRVWMKALKTSQHSCDFLNQAVG